VVQVGGFSPSFFITLIYEIHYHEILLYSINSNIKLPIEYVTPDIAAALKIYLWKEQISGILFFDGEWSCLRSRHLVLWSLGTLTGQQRFYGTGLITQREDIITY
jgi:hypothetical protein